MELELLLWGYLPILIGLVVIGGSFNLTLKRRNLLGLVATFLISVLNGLAIYILVQIISGSYPTYIPHLFILVSLILLGVQYWFKKKTFANNSNRCTSL